MPQVIGTTQATGTEPYEVAQAIKLKAGTPAGVSSTQAANILAGTVGWELVGALNKYAGNAPGHYRELSGVLNQLAGTTGLGENAAASRWAGR